MQISAKIIADTIGKHGGRITSLQLTMPRSILAQFNTHRMFSRSTASSRAIPVKKMIEQVRNDYVRPIHWGANQAGMMAEKELPIKLQEIAKEIWYKAAMAAADYAEQLNTLGKQLDPNDTTGLHKQHANRILEPYMWAHTIVTATEWFNFFALRLADDAQPEIQALARAMKDAMDSSEPTESRFHLPYITMAEILEWQQSKGITTNEILFDAYEYFAPISAARCARVSYLNHNQTAPVIERDLELANKLLDARHCFTPNTEVLTNNGWMDFSDVTEDTQIAAFNTKTAEFVGFENPIRVIDNEYVGNIYCYQSANIDIEVTDKHKMLGILIGTKTDRLKSYNDIDVIIPSGITGKSNRTNGEREMIMFSSARPAEVTNNAEFNFGKLLGFFIGDGYAAYNSSIQFRLKKSRKVEYLINLLNCLNLQYKHTVDKHGVHCFNVKNPPFNGLNFYNSEKRKYFPSLSFTQNELLGIFDGLKNSDGFVKRNTWGYDTKSKQLSEQILALAPLIGLTARLSNAECYQCEDLYRITFTTNNHIRLNDSRTENSKVVIKPYKGRVYCVEIPSNGIMVRRNGKTLLTHNCSPFEHQAQASEHRSDRYANFIGWQSYRYDLEKEWKL